MSTQYAMNVPATLRALADDADAQGEANLAVGWDDGPEQAAWLRALADAVAGRPAHGEHHWRGSKGCRVPAAHVTESPNCWCPRDTDREAGK